MKSPPASSGFSLLELLLAVAVIAIVTTIAVPNIANVTTSADAATRLRNAQMLATTFNAYAESYYAEYRTNPPQGTIGEIVTAMEAGLQVTNTRLRTTNFFRMPGISTNEVAVTNLQVSQGRLIYLGENSGS